MMTKGELGKLTLIQGAIDGVYTVREAAQRLGLSERRIKQLKGERFALHDFIDDATGHITALYLAENECLMGYPELLRQTLTVYGLPIGIYADKAGIFFVNTKK
jgi:hypothetical protein